MSLQPKGIGAPALGRQAWGELPPLYDQKPLPSVTVGDGEVKDDLLKVCCSHSNRDRSERPLNHIEAAGQNAESPGCAQPTTTPSSSLINVGPTPLKPASQARQRLAAFIKRR
ncbi:hypothetical protein AOLI_G00101630 [Acnodon oligacanthus]